MDRISLPWLLVAVAVVTATGSSGVGVPAGDARVSVDPCDVDDLSIDRPTGTYVLGNPTTVAGRAPESVESVFLYVRSAGEWHLLDLDEDRASTPEDAATVNADGRWRRTGVVLSNATTVLAEPGRYRLGVVAGANAVDGGRVRRTLQPSSFRAARSAETELVVRPSIDEEPAVFRDVGDEVATEDGVVTVRGTATGVDEVLVVVVDARGRIVSEILEVDDGIFDEEVSLTRPDGRSVAEGFAVGVVLSPGRDGEVGDGELPGEPGTDLAAFEAYLGERVAAASLSQEQVLEILTAESVADAGSDDRRIVDTFVVTDARTTIEAVYPANATERSGIRSVPVGETMVVRGRTNRRPEDNAILLDVRSGSTGRSAAFGQTETWGDDGVWSVTVETAGLDPGTYTVEVTDGEDGDRIRVELVNATNGSPVSRPSAAEAPAGRHHARRNTALRAPAPRDVCGKPVVLRRFSRHLGHSGMSCYLLSR